MGVVLSVVVPAYNEATRLPPYLKAIEEYFAATCSIPYEVIIVDDGSGDGLSGIVRSAAKNWPELVLLCQDGNQGKGAAIRAGMLAALGDMILFADADGATPIEEESKLRLALEGGADIAAGSRLVFDDLVIGDNYPSASATIRNPVGVCLGL